MTFGARHGIMWGVADPNESHRDRRAPDDNAHPPEPAGLPDVVDAEVVEEKPPATQSPDPTPSPQDSEAFRQYQQFLEFQKFQEWQRQQDAGGGTGPSGVAPGPTPRPWWKRALRLLRFKFIRRLLYLFLALVLIYSMINYYFGGSQSQDSSGNNLPGNLNPALSPVQGTPKDAIITVYTFLAYGDARTTCGIFTGPAGHEFATSNGGQDCPTAAQRLRSQVTDVNAYVNVKFTPDAVAPVQGEVKVSSCDVLVAGGPRLGTFHLRQQPNGGWLIDGYQGAPAQCPPG
jgi:hypothetical protein